MNNGHTEDAMRKLHLTRVIASYMHKQRINCVHTTIGYTAEVACIQTRSRSSVFHMFAEAYLVVRYSHVWGA